MQKFGKNTLRKSNGRPAIKASAVLPHRIAIHPGQPVTILCSDCSTWRRVERKLIRPHRLTDRGHGERDERCPGSNQLVDVDLTSEQWEERLREFDATAGFRRPTRVTRKPGRKAPPAVTQMQSRTAHLVRELADHQSGCARCRRMNLVCRSADRLRREINQVKKALISR
ncbi:hypothetical protein [Streptomyces mangrovi]|uniref:hypothetical protein n=1 Tax=Streptomyces mangrovi TaxID=1206892 RepID=UPI00399D2AD8